MYFSLRPLPTPLPFPWTLTLPSVNDQEAAITLCTDSNSAADITCTTLILSLCHLSRSSAVSQQYPSEVDTLLHMRPKVAV